MAKYNIGDIVRVRDDLEIGMRYGGYDFSPDMERYGGVVVEIRYVGESGYRIRGDEDGFCFTDEMLEPLFDFGNDTDTNVGNIVTRAYILDEAKKCVCGDRDNQYGSPEDNFATIGRFWTEYLKGKCVSPDADICVDADDVAAMMILFKVARIKTGTGGKDSWVDAAGYAACGGEIANAPESE